MLGFSPEVKNILNDQDIRTGGGRADAYELRPRRGRRLHLRPLPSKYFYPFGTTYYLNVYFPFLIEQSIIYEKS